MKISFLKTRFVGYLVLFSVLSWFLFNFLLNRQGTIMYSYFIEKPTRYNLERAERLASSIYQSFKKEVSIPTIGNITSFINKYNDIPFLSVNFVYQDDNGTMNSVLNDVKELDILSAEYVYPIKYENRDVGTLMVYDINKEYEKGMSEYDHMLLVTRISFAIMLVLLLSVLVFREYSAVIEHEKRKAEYRAVHDGLTGLYTQKYFKEFLQREVTRSQRYKRPISLIMCDIDHFKKFNDTYGHLCGDMVLKTVSGIVSTDVRSSDIVARYGGEEFAILLVESSMEHASAVATRLRQLTERAIDIAERIKSDVEHTAIQFDHTQVHVTMSMGVSSYNGHEDYKAEYLISEADHALYESKEKGRNLITIFDPTTKSFTSHP
ncbi:MAG: GGDEF domain-containing protein [Candidatus Omnitrophica bacterium]|nr:GGDEF domain-containing protein [Candidatus Omnitrophota bacterium]MDD5488593.1 GGDEF domain-containing protein [Candidatus Omnitrophota bacterium]